MFRLEKVPPIFGAFAFVTLLVMIPFIGLLLWIAFASFFRV